MPPRGHPLRPPVDGRLDATLTSMFLRFYFTANVVLLTMLAISYPFLRPGSASAVVAQLSLLVVVPSVLASGLVIYRRTRRAGR